MPQPLKDFIESGKKKFDERWSYASFTWNGDNATGVELAKQVKKNVLSFLSQRTTQAYELGKSETQIQHCDEPDCPECNLKAYNRGVSDTLAMVMREIEEIIKNNPLGERSIVIEEVFSTLKQKLSGNGE